MGRHRAGGGDGGSRDFLGKGTRVSSVSEIRVNERREALWHGVGQR